MPKMDVSVKYTNTNGEKVVKTKSVRCIQSTFASRGVNVGHCNRKAARIAAKMLPDANEVCE
jgi:hypothetical protein